MSVPLLEEQKISLPYEQATHCVLIPMRVPFLLCILRIFLIDENKKEGQPGFGEPLSILHEFEENIARHEKYKENGRRRAEQYAKAVAEGKDPGPPPNLTPVDETEAEAMEEKLNAALDRVGRLLCVFLGHERRRLAGRH